MSGGSRSQSSRTGITKWLHQNLFFDAANSVLSLALIGVIVLVLWNLFEWAVLNSVWNAESLFECRRIVAEAYGADAHGACWAFLNEKLDLLLFGFYPPELYWRPITAFVLLLLAIAPIVITSLPRKFLWLTLICPIFAWHLIWGGLGLSPVAARNFSGLMLTLLIALFGFALAIPSAIALALGRHFLILPLRRMFAMFIAAILHVPLLLYMFIASTLFNIFLPPGTILDIVTRVIVIIALHAGCQIAKLILNELQTLPAGHSEAASALGLSTRKTFCLVILPQIMRTISPQTVRIAVGAVRDTSLVAIIGLLEPLAFTTSIRADQNWHGIVWELFVFNGFLYWIICSNSDLI